jgi:hypothetical protein
MNINNKYLLFFYVNRWIQICHVEFAPWLKLKNLLSIHCMKKWTTMVQVIVGRTHFFPLGLQSREWICRRRRNRISGLIIREEIHASVWSRKKRTHLNYERNAYNKGKDTSELWQECIYYSHPVLERSNGYLWIMKKGIDTSPWLRRKEWTQMHIWIVRTGADSRELWSMEWISLDYDGTDMSILGRTE